MDDQFWSQLDNALPVEANLTSSAGSKPVPPKKSASVVSPRSQQPSRQGARLVETGGDKPQPVAPPKSKSRTPGWIKKESPRVPEPEPEPIPEPEPEPEPEPVKVNSDESVTEGGTGWTAGIMELSKFHKVESAVDAFHGSDKDERAEWTKLAEKAQSGRSAIANKVVKEHTRLIRISGKGKNITMTEVVLAPSSLCLSEVFLLDTGPIVYQWDGSTAGTFLKNKANWYLKMLRDERQGKFQTVLMNWDEENDQFFEILGGKPDNIPETNDELGHIPRLYRVTITVKGNLHFKEVGSGVGTVHKELLATKGVFLYDLGFEIILWEGKQAFKGLRDMAIQHSAPEFKSKFDKNPNTLVTRVKEGGLNPVFNAFIGGM